MKLLRFGPINNEKPGIAFDGKHYDLSGYIQDYTPEYLGNNGIAEIKNIWEKYKSTLPLIPTKERIGCPIAKPSKIICIGINYADHVRETKSEMPKEPVVFLKANSALSGPFDDIIIPKKSTKTDWEVELAVVIEKKASYVDENNAMNYVLGYTLHNDVSEREFQLERGGTWDKGKGCDTFAPIGPYIVSKDEIKNPHQLRLWLKVNDQMEQDGNTSELIFNIPTLVSYVSQFMTLYPGDIISTGTPHGVGLGHNPPCYLKDGDIVELGIDGIGISKQKVRKYI